MKPRQGGPETQRRPSIARRSPVDRPSIVRRSPGSRKRTLLLISPSRAPRFSRATRLVGRAHAYVRPLFTSSSLPLLLTQTAALGCAPQTRRAASRAQRTFFISRACASVGCAFHLPSHDDPLPPALTLPLRRLALRQPLEPGLRDRFALFACGGRG
jgi:hypothetical protein